jgi:hypothetical protein
MFQVSGVFKLLFCEAALSNFRWVLVLDSACGLAMACKIVKF